MLGSVQNVAQAVLHAETLEELPHLSDAVRWNAPRPIRRGPRVWCGRDALPRVRRCTSASRGRPLYPALHFRFLVRYVHVLRTHDAGRAGAHPCHMRGRSNSTGFAEKSRTSHQTPFTLHFEQVRAALWMTTQRFQRYTFNCGNM